jgi:hypothetical protein
MILEERLLKGYQAQLELYDRAAEILDRACSGDADDDHWAHAVHARLQDAAALDGSMAQDVAAWRESGRKPIGPLKDMIECLSQRIQSLSESIDRQVGEMRARQQGLTAEMDEFIQKRRMLQAYVNRA